MQNATGRAADTTIPMKMQMQGFSSSHLQEEKDWFSASVRIQWKDTSVNLVRLFMHLKYIHHIIGCQIRNKEIPKIHKLKIKFKNKNIEKKWKSSQFFKSTVIRSASCKETQFTKCRHSKWFWKTNINPTILISTASFCYSNCTYCLVNLLSYTQM